MTKDTTLLTIATALRSLGQAGILVVIAQLATPEKVGAYSLSLAITAPIFVLLELGLRTVYLTHRHDHSFFEYLRVRLLALIAATGLTVAIALFFANSQVVLLLLVAILRCADSLGELYTSPLQLARKYMPIVVNYAIAAISTVVVGIFMIKTTRSLEPMVLGMIAVSMCATFAVRLKAKEVLTVIESDLDLNHMPLREIRRDILRAGLPTGISWSLLSLLSTVPQYFLAATYSQADVGHFAIILYAVVVAEIYMNALTQSWIPSAKKMLSSPRGFLTGVIWTIVRWTLVFIPVSAVGCLCAYFGLPLVFGSAFAIHWGEIIPLGACVIALPIVFFSSMALNVANKYRAGLVVSSATMLLTLIACALIIPVAAVPGALWVIFTSLLIRGLLSSVGLYIRRPSIRVTNHATS